jgi:hypothetical protein
MAGGGSAGLRSSRAPSREAARRSRIDIAKAACNAKRTSLGSGRRAAAGDDDAARSVLRRGRCVYPLTPFPLVTNPAWHCDPSAPAPPNAGVSASEQSPALAMRQRADALARPQLVVRVTLGGAIGTERGVRRCLGSAGWHDRYPYWRVRLPQLPNLQQFLAKKRRAHGGTRAARARGGGARGGAAAPQCARTTSSTAAP